jgi:KDO2-lipid IV(A) lauroyltransferase
MKYQPKQIFEYILLRLITGLIRILPLRAALSLGWVGAAGTHFIGRINVKRTHERIREVFGDRYSDKERRHIAWIAWRNLCFNAIEALRFSMLTPEKILQQPLAAAALKVKKIQTESDRGLILATPHMGNWEIAGIAGDLLDIPLFVIARKQKNPLVNDFINKMRQSFNLEVLQRESKMWKGVVDRLKQGKVMAILPDIGARRKGISIDFLNGRTNIAPGTAHFSQLAQCPIYPVCVRRIGWTRHDAVLLDPVFPDASADKTEDQKRMMQEVMSALSAEICKTPEQYFWYNKRWVLSQKKYA